MTTGNKNKTISLDVKEILPKMTIYLEILFKKSYRSS